jgi:hypothetical protein
VAPRVSEVSKQEIRAFLSVVGAFAFHESERLKLNPDDQVFAVYSAVYSHRGLPDMLELETLAARRGCPDEG